MGAGDDLVSGMSTFLLELWNTSFILDKATPNSLVILVRMHHQLLGLNSDWPMVSGISSPSCNI